MKKSFIALAVTLGMLVVGCGLQGGKTIVTQGATADPTLITAPETGTYKLYTAFSPNPTTTVKLKEGDPLGFRKTSDGHIEAVAGDQTQVLSGATAQAYWKLEN